MNAWLDAIGGAPITWMVAGQFLVYAAGWGVAGWLLRERSQGLVHWAAFMLFLGLGFWLVTMRTDERAWAAFVGSNLAFATAATCLWRGLSTFTRVRGLGTEQAVTLALFALFMVGSGPGLENAAMRVVFSYSGMAWLFGRATWSVYPALAPEFGRTAARSIGAVGACISGVMLALLVSQISQWPQALELQRFNAANPVSMFAYVVLAAVFNFAFMGLLTTRLMRQLREQSRRDALTGLYNRRALNDHLQRAWGLRQRTRADFAVLVIDIDHFKRINDRLGHHGGDVVLAETARRLAQAAREVDVVARFGGEEFVVLMPATGGAGARTAAERLRGALRGTRFEVGGQMVEVTASIGVAAARPDDADAEACVRRADQALYQAKEAGRDRVAGES